MKKISTAAAKQSRNFRNPSLTIGLDLGDRSSWYCVLDEAGESFWNRKLSTTPKAMKQASQDAAQPDRAGDRDAFAVGQPAAERVGTRSDRGPRAQCAADRREPEEGRSAGCADPGAAGANRSAVVVAGAASQREGASPSDGDPGASGTGASANGAGERGPRTDEVVWRTAARLQRAQHESRESGGIEPRTASCTGAAAGGNSKSLSERISEYDQQIEKLAQQSYPEVALLKQVKGVGTLIALTFMLTLEDPHRFRKSRDVGCYLGLQPGRRNSGQSEPQMHISKEGDRICARCWCRERTTSWDRLEQTAICGDGV